MIAAEKRDCTTVVDWDREVMPDAKNIAAIQEWTWQHAKEKWLEWFRHAAKKGLVNS